MVVSCSRWDEACPTVKEDATSGIKCLINYYIPTHGFPQLITEHTPNKHLGPDVGYKLYYALVSEFSIPTEPTGTGETGKKGGPGARTGGTPGISAPKKKLCSINAWQNNFTAIILTIIDIYIYIF